MQKSSKLLIGGSRAGNVTMFTYMIVLQAGNGHILSPNSTVYFALSSFPSLVSPKASQLQ